MCILATHNLYGIRTHEKPSSEMQMEMTITAAIINLIVIKVLNFVYNKLAIWLNNLELKRTQNEYDEALSTKIYLLHFINYYSSIFYIALIKGKFVGTPNKYNRIFGLRQEECSHAGCLLDLFVQLGIIMIGGQAFNAVYEYLIEPFTSYFIRKVVIDKCGGNKLKIVSPLIVCNQWTEDYNLKTYTQNGLFDEYLEMSKDLQLFNIKIFSQSEYIFSYAIWICHNIRDCISAGTIVRFNQQHVGNSLGCQEIFIFLSSVCASSSAKYWCVVLYNESNRKDFGSIECTHNIFQ